MEDGAAALILPGQTAATQKTYKILRDASVAEGDLVLCARLSGTVVIIGAVT